MAKKTNGKASKGAASVQSFELKLIPPPEGALGPKKALAWLREDFPGYAFLLEDGVANPTKGSEWAYFTLAHDLREMVKACAEAIVSRKPVRVGRHSEDQCQTVESLARIVSHPEATDTGFPCRDGAVSALGRELVAKLAAGGA